MARRGSGRGERAAPSGLDIDARMAVPRPRAGGAGAATSGSSSTTTGSASSPSTDPSPDKPSWILAPEDQPERAAIVAKARSKSPAVAALIRAAGPRRVTTV